MHVGRSPSESAGGEDAGTAVIRFASTLLPSVRACRLLIFTGCAPACKPTERPDAPRCSRRDNQAQVCVFLNRTTVDAPESKANVISFGPTSGAFTVRRRR